VVYYLNKAGELISLEIGSDGRFGQKSPVFLAGNFRAFDADTSHLVAAHLASRKVSIKQLAGEVVEKESDIIADEAFKLNHVLLARGVVVAIGYSTTSTLIQILDKKSLKKSIQEFVETRSHLSHQRRTATSRRSSKRRSSTTTDRV